MSRPTRRRTQHRLDLEFFGRPPKDKRPRPQRERGEKPYQGFGYEAPPLLASRPGACGFCGDCCWPSGSPWVCPHCGVIYPVVHDSAASGRPEPAELERATAAYIARWGVLGFRFEDHMEAWREDDTIDTEHWRAVATACQEELAALRRAAGAEP